LLLLLLLLLLKLLQMQQLGILGRVVDPQIFSQRTCKLGPRGVPVVAKNLIWRHDVQADGADWLRLRDTVAILDFDLILKKTNTQNENQRPPHDQVDASQEAITFSGTTSRTAT
jgi:hypothetical protein